jgi:hypothetical protein
MKTENYFFIDNSFLFVQGYKHVRTVAKLPATKKVSIDYSGFRKFLSEQGDLKRTVIVGSNLAGSLISKCQFAGFEVFTFPKYPDIKSGHLKEKGIDHKICWEIGKTIFTNKENAGNKKIILCSGDKDFMAILPDIHTSNWHFELWLWTNSFSQKFVDQVKCFGDVKILDQEWKKFIKII